MRRSVAFRAAGWEPLEGRSLLSVAAGPAPMVAARDAAAPEKGEIVMLGDSITFFWPTRGASSWRSAMAPRGAVDLGVFGHDTQDVLDDVAAGRIPGRPKVVILMIGINDLARGSSPAEVARGVAADVAAIRAAEPQAHVLLMGVLPADPSQNRTLMAKVPLLNAMIARLDDDARVHFLDIGRAFLLPDGSQNAALFTSGLHLNASGYQIWADRIGSTLDVLTGHPIARTPKPPKPVPRTPPPAPSPTRLPTTGPWSLGRR